MGEDKAIAQAVGLYKGDLAPEISQDWILPRRVLLREGYFSGLIKLGRAAEKSQQFEQALGYYQRLSFEDPLREDAQRGRLRALASLGRHGEARDAYEQFVHRLQSELAATPSNKTTALANQLRQEWDMQQAVAVGAKIPPFVGRAVERAQLLARLDQA